MPILILTILLACAAAYALGVGKTYYTGPASDHFDGRQFFNPGINVDKTRADLIKWRKTAQRAVWPLDVPYEPQEKPPARVDGADMRVTFVGHATFLIQANGLNILTDPFLSDRASPLPFMGPKRVRPPAVAFDDLPKIDIVLVSHNHYDHLDRAALKRLHKRDNPVIVTPLGNDKIIDLPNTRMLDWGQATEPMGAHITLEQAYHWSARGLWDRRKALWGAFVVKLPAGSVYFGGDTAFIDGKIFGEARDKHGPFRLALLPVGAYEPRWFMQTAHMNPEDAVKAWTLLGKPFTLGMHFGTVQLTDEPIDAPGHALAEALKMEGAPEAGFRMPEFGKGLNVKGLNVN